MRLAINLFKMTFGVSCLALGACGGGGTVGSNAATSQVAMGSVMKAAAARSTASPNGTTIPSAAQIIDGSGNTWTVTGGVISMDGALAGYSNAVTLLVYDNGIIYQENSAGGWWSWSGTTWVATTEPPAVNGTCGSTNGMAVKTTPVVNLCSAGTASAVGGTGPWTWSCGGANGGKTAACAATVTAPPVAVPSPEGTTIPSATQITDSGGAMWTVSSGIVYKNGSLAGYTNAVTLLLYDNNIIYQENSAGGWWSWNGSSWVGSSDPRIVPVNGVCGTTNGMAVKVTPVANLCSAGTASAVSGSGPWTWSCGGIAGGKTASCSATLATPVVVTSPEGTTIPSASQIIDSAGGLWTLSGGVVYKNGALAGYTNAVTLLLYDNNIVYQENSSGGWWSWNGSTWTGTTDPRNPPTAPPTAPPVSPPVATTVAISGTPPTTDNVGQAYSFVPTVSNPSGAKLSFSITNLPAWATFNTATGALAGTPGNTQAGSYPNIAIGVSNGSASAALAAFSITVTMGSASLSWTAPTENTNGAPLTNLAGYTIYYGPSASEMTQTIQVANPGATSYVVGNLSAGTYYFAISAYTTMGTQSAQSAVGSTTIL